MEVYKMKPHPQWSTMEQVAYKKLAHGHVCQICQESIITYHDAVVAYRIPVGPDNQQDYGMAIYSKANWSIVCSQYCADRLFKFHLDPIKKANVIKQIKSSNIKKIPRVKGDGYREEVMKECGIDPTMANDFKVYHTDDVWGPISDWMRKQ